MPCARVASRVGETYTLDIPLFLYNFPKTTSRRGIDMPCAIYIHDRCAGIHTSQVARHSPPDTYKPQIPRLPTVFTGQPRPTEY